MRKKIRKLLAWLFHKTDPPPLDQRSTIKLLNNALVDLATRDDAQRTAYMERVSELVEARQMAGAGPWTVSPATMAATDRIIDDARERYGKPHRMALQESAIPGANVDINLMIANADWRRDIGFSGLEFSRWGIQQIILIGRLYYIKNPIIRRLIDVCAAYVFARGVEVTASNDAANDELRDFFERNKETLGQNALCDLERRKDYDGNIYYVLFTDTQSKGKVNCRVFDATEIQEIITDPEDQSKPWFYKRVWSQRTFNQETGVSIPESMTAWYPALWHDPADKVKEIGSKPVMWDSPIKHRKCGGVANWLFGCPRMFPAYAWATESRKYLEACASQAAALASISRTITTKGGQQALMGIKNQLGTTVNSGVGGPWDDNPAELAGSTFASGPGTKLETMKTRGGGTDPEEVRQFKLMCCMVAGVPETFLGDVSTGNLATATSLDRPTETIFLEKQESWREDLVDIARWVLTSSKRATGGKLREVYNGLAVDIVECERKRLPNGTTVYREFRKNMPTTLEIRCNFPAIREGDIPTLVTATCQAITDGNMDPKAGVRKLYDLLGVENGDELTEKQYPDASYDPDKTKEPAGGEPALSDPALRRGVKEALRRLRGATVDAPRP
jgi:hypothetical protein